MDSDAHLAMVDRVFQMTESGSAEAVAEWPVNDYLDPARFEREMSVLRTVPYPLTHTSQLAEPGQFRVERLFGRSVIVVHSHSGGYRALLNVCRHRGAEVAGTDCGTVKKFMCPYHAWTYDTDGRLSHVPDEQRSFPGLRHADRGLTELPLEVRHGLLWVTAEGTGQPVAEFLGPELDADLAASGAAAYTVHESGAQTRRFNWKTGAESFMESYHFAVLHRETAGRIFLHNAGAYDQLGPHFRTLAPKKTLREKSREQWTTPGTATFMYLIFPSVAMFVEKDHINLLVIIPVTVDTCRVIRTHLVARPRPRLREYWDENIALFMDAVNEDLDICESMQRGYASGANSMVTFGRNEGGCTAYRRAVETMLGFPAATGTAGVSGAARAR